MRHPVASLGWWDAGAEVTGAAVLSREGPALPYDRYLPGEIMFWDIDDIVESDRVRDQGLCGVSVDAEASEPLEGADVERDLAGSRDGHVGWQQFDVHALVVEQRELLHRPSRTLGRGERDHAERNRRQRGRPGEAMTARSWHQVDFGEVLKL